MAIALNIGAIVSCLLAGVFVNKLGRRLSFCLTFLGGLACCLGTFLTTKAFSSTLFIWAFCVGFFAVLPFALLFIYVPEIY